MLTPILPVTHLQAQYAYLMTSQMRSSTGRPIQVLLMHSKLMKNLTSLTGFQVILVMSLKLAVAHLLGLGPPLDAVTTWKLQCVWPFGAGGALPTAHQPMTGFPFASKTRHDDGPWLGHGYRWLLGHTNTHTTNHTYRPTHTNADDRRLICRRDFRIVYSPDGSYRHPDE